MMKKNLWFALSAACVLLIGCDDSGGSDKSDRNDPNGSSESDTVTTQKCDDKFEETCSGDEAHFCNDDGVVVVRDCAALDDGSECRKMADYNLVDCVVPCDEKSDEMACDGKKPVRKLCSETTQGNGELYMFTFLGEACDAYCSDGKCVDSVEYVEGDPCDDSFIPGCKEKNGYNCVGGKIKKTTCEDDLACAVRYGGKETECVETCSASTSYMSGGCSIHNSTSIAKRGTCEPATDGKYYVFVTEEQCVYGCTTSGVCDGANPEVGKKCDAEKFRGICLGGSAYNCDASDGTIFAMKCGRDDFRGQPLCREEGGEALCLTPCDRGDEPILNCATREEDGKKISYTDNYVCRKSSGDYGYYYFNERKDCAGSCNNGACQ